MPCHWQTGQQTTFLTSCSLALPERSLYRHGSKETKSGLQRHEQDYREQQLGERHLETADALSAIFLRITKRRIEGFVFLSREANREWLIFEQAVKLVRRFFVSRKVHVAANIRVLDHLKFGVIKGH